MINTESNLISASRSRGAAYTLSGSSRILLSFGESICVASKTGSHFWGARAPRPLFLAPRQKGPREARDTAGGGARAPQKYNCVCDGKTHTGERTEVREIVFPQRLNLSTAQPFRPVNQSTFIL